MKFLAAAFLSVLLIPGVIQARSFSIPVWFEGSVPDTILGRDLQIGYYQPMHGREEKRVLVPDARGGFVVKERFRNMLPACVSLLLDGAIVDRYCFVEGTRRSKGYPVLRNIYDSSQVQGVYEDGVHVFANLFFNSENFRLDTAVILFDKTSLGFGRSEDGKNIEVRVRDPSASLGNINIYYRNSDYEHVDIPHQNGFFEIPVEKLKKRKIPMDNTLFIRAYSKRGWYKDFQATIWESR